MDIILEAHEHSYERLWPVYNENVTARDYINPAAPVHLVSGTAGCREGVDPMLGPRGMVSATNKNVMRHFELLLHRSVVCISFLVSIPSWVWEIGGGECYSCSLGASDRR